MLQPDYKDMLRCLSTHGAEYLIVGAYAMAAHGVPRATGDIDIFIDPAPGNARRVHAALSDFGAPMTDIPAEEFAVEGVVYQIGVAPCRIDILTKIDGVSFAEAKSGRVILEIDGLRIPFIGLAELKKNKLSTPRAKDKLDVELLNEQQDLSRQ